MCPVKRTKILLCLIFSCAERRGGWRKRRTDERSNLDVVFVHSGHCVGIERRICVKRYEGDVRFIYICKKDLKNDTRIVWRIIIANKLLMMMMNFFLSPFESVNECIQTIDSNIKTK
jgi:hypothetical protein